MSFVIGESYHTAQPMLVNIHVSCLGLQVWYQIPTTILLRIILFEIRTFGFGRGPKTSYLDKLLIANLVDSGPRFIGIE